MHAYIRTFVSFANFKAVLIHFSDRLLLLFLDLTTHFHES